VIADSYLEFFSLLLDHKIWVFQLSVIKRLAIELRNEGESFEGEHFCVLSVAQTSPQIFIKLYRFL